jgi:tetratricopeptide (TPR) repeat protein
MFHNLFLGAGSRLRPIGRDTTTMKEYAFCFMLCLLLAGMASGVESEDQPQDRKLSAQGMELVDSWSGKSDVLNRAQALFEEALRINPSSAEAITGLGRVEMSRGYQSGDDFDKEALLKTLEYVDKAISMNGAYLSARVLRGQALIALGDMEGALKEAETLERLDSSFCGKYTLRAAIFEKQGDIRKAINEVKKHLSCPATMKNARSIHGDYKSLANMHYEIKEDAEADHYYRSVIESPFAIAWDYGNYSRVLMRMGKLDDAEWMAKRAISMMDYPLAHKFLSAIHNSRAHEYEKLGKYKEAEEEYFRSVSENPSNLSVYYRLQAIFGKRGECQRFAEIYSGLPGHFSKQWTKAELKQDYEQRARELQQAVAARQVDLVLEKYSVTCGNAGCYVSGIIRNKAAKTCDTACVTFSLYSSRAKDKFLGSVDACEKGLREGAPWEVKTDRVRVDITPNHVEVSSSTCK